MKKEDFKNEKIAVAVVGFIVAGMSAWQDDIVILVSAVVVTSALLLMLDAYENK